MCRFALELYIKFKYFTKLVVELKIKQKLFNSKLIKSNLFLLKMTTNAEANDRLEEYRGKRN